jgi:hypothetical protein
MKKSLLLRVLLHASNVAETPYNSSRLYKLYAQVSTDRKLTNIVLMEHFSNEIYTVRELTTINKVVNINL